MTTDIDTDHRNHMEQVRERIRRADAERAEIAEALAPALLILTRRGIDLREIARRMQLESPYHLAQLLNDYGHSRPGFVADEVEQAIACGHGYRYLDSCPSCDQND